MPPSEQSAVLLLIRGRVQGIGFRFFAQETASALGLTGWVRNVAGGEVEAFGEGLRPDLETWIAKLRQGPPLARVESLEASWQAPQGSFESFSIR